MVIAKTKRLSRYCKLSDERGEFQGIVNQGSWQEVNIVYSHASTTRGGHFHRHTTEVIFLLKGKAEVEVASCDRPNEKTWITLLAGEGVQISPMTVHVFHYSEDSTHLQLLDSCFDPIQPDLVNIDTNHDAITDDSTDSTLD